MFTRHFKFLIQLCLLLFFFSNLRAQQNKKLISGPWAGNVEFRTAMIWLEVSSSVKSVAVKYYSIQNKAITKTIDYKGELGKAFNPLKIELNGLEFDTRYEYNILLDNKPCTLPFTTQFTTKDLWQYRKPAPDFSFLTGSCAYFNDPKYDRPGKPYGSDSSIFETMALNLSWGTTCFKIFKMFPCNFSTTACTFRKPSTAELSSLIEFSCSLIFVFNCLINSLSVSRS